MVQTLFLVQQLMIGNSQTIGFGLIKFQLRVYYLLQYFWDRN